MGERSPFLQVVQYSVISGAVVTVKPAATGNRQ